MGANDRLSILLVEDSLADAELIEIFLHDDLNVPFTLFRETTLSSTLERLGEGEIDVILLDLSLPDSEGIDTFLKCRDCANGLPIVVLTGLDEETCALSAVRQGAQDYLVKGKTDGKLLARSLRFAVERATQLERHLSERAEIAQRLVEIAGRLKTLTAREREVMGQIVDGIPMKRIAGNLGTSYFTVKNQRSSILKKMDAATVADLVRMVMVVRFGGIE